uniref:mycofactocin oligosaccharide methyltransferase MftM n=1 Tax=Nocardia farcinica TaxID=37329 RepID=UPI002454FDD4
ILDDVLAELAERRREFRDRKYVPRDFVARLKEAGIYRAATPRRLGGGPPGPHDPAAAWRLFYDNTLAQIRRCWDSPNPPPTHIAQIAPVYRRALGLVPPGRVLDMGSCFGFFPLLLADAGQHRVLATDLVPGSMNLLRTIAQARGSAVGTMSCDAAAVPLPDRCVDTVTVLHLLEHLDRAHGRAVLAEAVRLAAQRVIVAVPFEDEPDPSYGHIRTFDTGELSILGIETGLPFTVAEYHGGWLILDTR